MWEKVSSKQREGIYMRNRVPKFEAFFNILTTEHFMLATVATPGGIRVEWITNDIIMINVHADDIA